MSAVAPCVGVVEGRDALDAAILNAHAVADENGLITLYGLAGDQAASGGDVDAACFYWTHARVFALANGHSAADSMLDRLAAYGRDA